MYNYITYNYCFRYFLYYRNNIEPIKDFQVKASSIKIIISFI